MQAADTAIIEAMLHAGASSAGLWRASRWLTELGGAVGLWIVTLGVAAWLWSRREVRRAALLLAIVSGGRFLVEVLKLAVDRPRPTLVDHPVYTYSHSFPSGHAANSMIVYLVIALLVLRTRSAVAAAIILAVLIGLTRALLGVHWPSDILAGWCLGLAWTLAMVQLSRGWLDQFPDRSGS